MTSFTGKVDLDKALRLGRGCREGSGEKGSGIYGAEQNDEKRRSVEIKFDESGFDEFYFVEFRFDTIECYKNIDSM